MRFPHKRDTAIEPSMDRFSFHGIRRHRCGEGPAHRALPRNDGIRSLLDIFQWIEFCARFMGEFRMEDGGGQPGTIRSGSRKNPQITAERLFACGKFMHRQRKSRDVLPKLQQPHCQCVHSVKT